MDTGIKDSYDGKTSDGPPNSICCDIVSVRFLFGEAKIGLVSMEYLGVLGSSRSEKNKNKFIQ